MFKCPTGYPRLALLLSLFACGPAKAAVSDPNFTESTYYSAPSFLSATGMAWAPDGSGRLFVILKNGAIRVFENGSLLPTPFATETVFTNSECGLIGMAFDPGFATNGYIYFFATRNSSEQHIIRYTASGNIGTNRTVIVSGLPTVGNNHDGGAVGIGRDGKLYWAIGDLGNFTGVGLDTSNLASKVGRANRDGTIPSDNPFADGPGGSNDYIYAGGLRNPFTFTFQPGTGALWVNVVGDNYEQVFTVGRGDNIGYTTGRNENAIPSGSPSPYNRYITPIIKYRTNGSDTRNIASSAASGAVRSGNVVTLTTTGVHGFRRGERFALTGVTNSSFNGTFFITGTPSVTTFTYDQTGANATSGGGTAQTLHIGGSITGGTFLDTTAVPAAYRGNFFFCDYVSGRVIRSTLDASNNVTSVHYFATDLGGAVDMSVGPDGALYGLRINGTILRYAFNQSTQGLIVTPTQLQTDEGARIAFNVRLAIAPASNTTVNVARTSGDADLTITSGASLTFTPANWATPQTVLLNAAEDPDASDDTAVFTVSSASLTSETVTLFALDNDTPEIAPSTSSHDVNEGSSNTFSISLTGPPLSSSTLTVARTSGDTDISVTGGSSLTFNNTNFSTPQNVTISAAEDADALSDTAVITISGTGFANRTVTITTSDNDSVAPVIITSAPVSAVINATYTYDVNANGNPASTFSLTDFPTGMGISSTTGVITWTPSALGSFNAIVQAANGTLPNANQSFTINVVPDQPPTASLTQPFEGEFVSGANAEFFGDGFDDVRTVRGEFYVNNVLEYTDNTPGGHYHIGGAHNLFDTTGLSNGAHVVRMTVVDTAGQTASVERNIIVANGGSRWEAWRLAKFTTAELANPDVSGELVSFDGDPFNTLLEYALNGNPKLPDDIAPILGMDSGRATITFTRVIGATDLIYTPEAVSDLTQPWSAAGFTLINTVPNGATEQLTYRDDAVIPPDENRFLRLKVTRTP